MIDFDGLSRIEQDVFAGAVNYYAEPPVLANSDSLWMMTRDGDWIAGVFAPGSAKNDLCVIYFYGSNENLRGAEAVLKTFRDLGVAVLCFDYRGYGASTGRPSERSFQTDAEFAFDWLSTNHPALKIAAAGRSIGGAVAAYLAGQRPVHKLLTFSAPTNMVEIVRDSFSSGDIIIEEALPFRFDTAAYLAGVNCPIFIAHGEQDEIVPYAMSDSLAAHAGSSAITRHTVIGASHGTLFARGGDELWKQIKAFLATRP